MSASPPSNNFTINDGSSNNQGFKAEEDQAGVYALASPSTSSYTGTWNPAGGAHTLTAWGENPAGVLSATPAYFNFNVLGPQFTSPESGATTTGQVTLAATFVSGYPYVTFNYWRGTNKTAGAVKPIPVTNLTPLSANPAPAPTNWPWSGWYTNGSAPSTTPPLNWNLASTMQGIDGPVNLQVCYSTTSGGTQLCGTTQQITLDQLGTTGSSATTSTAAGNVTLNTGTLVTSAGDAAVPGPASGLTLARTFDSRQPSAGTASAPMNHLTVEEQDVEDTGDTTGFTAGNSTLVLNTYGAWSGKQSLTIKPTGASNDSYVAVGGDNLASSFSLGMVPGHTYTLSTHIAYGQAAAYTDAAANTTRGLRPVFFWTDSSGVTHEVDGTPAAAGGAGVVWQSNTFTFLVPAAAKGGFLRLYNGSSNSNDNVFYDGTSLTESSIFGPGWQSSTPVDDVSTDGSSLTDTGDQLTLTNSDDTITPFAQDAAGIWEPAGDAIDSGDSVAVGTSAGSGPATYTIAGLDGTSTTYAAQYDGSPATNWVTAASGGTPHRYYVSAVTEPGTGVTTHFVTNSAGQITQVNSPVPTPKGGTPHASTCTNSDMPASGQTATWLGGCRGLRLTYGTYDLASMVVAVTYASIDPATHNPVYVDVACYTYAYFGPTNAQLVRLTGAWDPRFSGTADGTDANGWTHHSMCAPALGGPTTAQKASLTSYNYDSLGRLSTITPPAQAPVVLTYDDSTAGQGRLVTVARTHNSANGGGTEATNLYYGVPLAADPNNPANRPDLSCNDKTAYSTGYGASNCIVANWGQRDLPVGATAVLPPQPTGTAATSTTGDLRPATIDYYDSAGNQTNSAGYAGTGATGWHIATTEYDGFNRVTRTLSALNREEALIPTTAEQQTLGLSATNSQSNSRVLDTQNAYTLGADGITDLTDTWGPYHGWVDFDGSTYTGYGRTHTHTDYDTGNEAGRTPDLQGKQLHLPVDSWTASSNSSAAVPVSGNTTETNKRTTNDVYATPAGCTGTGSSGNCTDTTGWTLRKPLQTITDPGGLNLINASTYDVNSGNVLTASQPSAQGGTTGANTTVSTYYTYDGTNTESPSTCVSEAWTGLLCKSGPAAAPGTSGLAGLPTSSYSYDLFGRPTTVTQTVTDASGTSHNKTAATTYDDNGYSDRPTGSSLTTDGTLTAVGATTDTYDPNTGLLATMAVAATATNAADSQTYGYDDFGRRTSYQSSDTPLGQPVATAYDSAGRVSTVTDGRGTSTYGYNSGTEYRNMATSLTVSGVIGSFAATYDADGSLATQTLPNGLVQTYTRDEADQTTMLSDTLTVGGTPTTVFSSQRTYTDLGQISIQNDTAGTSVINQPEYAYDNDGRESADYDLYASASQGCLYRTYSYGPDSNRLEADVRQPNSDGTCNKTSTPAATNHSYDIAYRLLPGTGSSPAESVNLFEAVVCMI